MSYSCGCVIDFVMKSENLPTNFNVPILLPTNYYKIIVKLKPREWVRFHYSWNRFQVGVLNFKQTLSYALMYCTYTMSLFLNVLTYNNLHHGPWLQR